MVSDRTVQELQNKAKEIRRLLMDEIYMAKSGHPGGALSAADILTALYFHEMRLNPKQPKWDERDRFILSKGHVCPVLYACLASKGYFKPDVLKTLRREDSILQGHPDMKRCPGIDMSTGSLGQGLSAGAGMALRAKRDGMDYRVFVMIGDGESNEGQIWEAVQTASKYGLDNLVIIVDHNRLQCDGTCDEIMPTGDLAAKFTAFGCDTKSIDGHDMEQILAALENTHEKSGKPHCIVCATVKGKGVSYMENVVEWHGMPPDRRQYLKALEELKGQ